MTFSNCKHLYSRILSSDSVFITMFLEDDEIEFLDENHITYKKCDDGYLVDSNKLKMLFCNC